MRTGKTVRARHGSRLPVRGSAGVRMVPYLLCGAMVFGLVSSAGQQAMQWYEERQQAEMASEIARRVEEAKAHFGKRFAAVEASAQARVTEAELRAAEAERRTEQILREAFREIVPIKANVGGRGQ